MFHVANHADAVLTRAHVKALRDLDVTFHTTREGAYLRCWSPDRDGSVQVPVREATVDDYRKQVGTLGYSCFAMLISRFDPDWQTIARTITPGCTLSLRWTAHNQSPVLDDAGLVRDEVRIRVEKPNGKAHQFLVAVQVGPDNSARMVRPIR